MQHSHQHHPMRPPHQASPQARPYLHTGPQTSCLPALALHSPSWPPLALAGALPRTSCHRLLTLQQSPVESRMLQRTASAPMAVPVEACSLTQAASHGGRRCRAGMPPWALGGLQVECTFLAQVSRSISTTCLLALGPLLPILAHTSSRVLQSSAAGHRQPLLLHQQLGPKAWPLGQKARLGLTATVTSQTGWACGPPVRLQWGACNQSVPPHCFEPMTC